MPTYVILLRAVNLAGHGKLPMADFRKMLIGLGFEKVETYIQSGNAVVDAKGSAAKVAQAVAAGLEKLMGAPCGVVVRTHDQMDRVIRENPYAAEAAAKGAFVHVGFLAGSAGPLAAAGLDRIVTMYPKRRDRYHLAAIALSAPARRCGRDEVFRQSARQSHRRDGNCTQLEHVLKLHAMSKR